MEGVKKVTGAADRIRRLEVQGATNVAFAAVEALVEQMKESKARDRAAIFEEFAEAKQILFASRETEPFMRNAIRFLEWKITEAEWNTNRELNELIHNIAEELLDSFMKARQRIAEIGAKRISSGTCVLTHCHSSAVSTMFRLARERGADFEVIVTETRPVYQGRITAKELLEAGIRTSMIVDSAVRSFIKRVDLVVVGADAITSEGNVINKIGTSMVAMAAHEARIPFYVVTELLKFDPQTIHGEYEAIEERSGDEVWPNAPGGLAIMNPAFDVTRRDHIHGIVCEEGFISPHSILEAVRRRYPWILEQGVSST